ncbi:uncharacterized protein LOC108441342 isoform X2 [Pygocentrus nattereri]|uniref:uncharacterized protein LOC108441342 isoform X2 n=1 Tax=Pygocentrus nattereri TaxID=42514 RepID=UPI00081470BC|nr:uncharacterized protein LOC108441342 isoform X2 [Pygocentrus nattereri]
MSSCCSHHCRTDMELTEEHAHYQKKNIVQMTLSQWIAIISLCCMLPYPVTSAKGNWTVVLPQQSFNITKCDNITINCTMKYPEPEEGKKKIQVFWKAKDKGTMNIGSKDRNVFIYHHNVLLVMKNFQNRTRLLGNINDYDCSLLIIDAQRTDVGQYYLRVETGSEEYSFREANEIIHIVDVNCTVPENIPVGNAIAIAGPVVPILLVAAVVVIVLLLRRNKRRRNPVRQEMNCYENFQVSCEKPNDDGHDSTKDKEEEPPFTPEDTSIYANFQGEVFEEPTDFDPTENIYSNVGYDMQL